MEQLRIGDQILTGQAKPRYEAVYAFGHYQPEAKGTFLVIETQNGGTLEITGEHLIFVESKTHPVRASSVRIGDSLATNDGPVAVSRISTITKNGLYAPLTPHGTLLVSDGIQASCYISVLQNTDDFFLLADGTSFLSMHDGVHLFLAPFRLYCRAAVATLGDRSSACRTYNENGLPPYVDAGIQFLTWLNGQYLVAQILAIVGTFPLFGFAMALEKLLFGGVLVFLLAAAAALLCRTMFMLSICCQQSLGKTKTL